MQKHGHLESQWDSIKKLNSLIWSFQGFANKVTTCCCVCTKLSSELKYIHTIKESGMFLVTLKVNNDCDADRDSYDAMVLLTGRYDFEEIKSPRISF